MRIRRAITVSLPPKVRTGTFMFRSQIPREGPGGPEEEANRVHKLALRLSILITIAFGLLVSYFVVSVENVFQHAVGVESPSKSRFVEIQMPGLSLRKIPFVQNVAKPMSVRLLYEFYGGFEGRFAEPLMYTLHGAPPGPFCVSVHRPESSRWKLEVRILTQRFVTIGPLHWCFSERLDIWTTEAMDPLLVGANP